MPVNQLYGEYAQLEADIAALELKKEQLRPHILQKMLDDGTEKVDVGVGKFSIFSVKKWTYPEEVVAIGDEFKAAKAKAESTGEATCEERPSFKFTNVKL